jgi:ATP-dependent DNA helicase RecG
MVQFVIGDYKMNKEEFEILIEELRALPKECEWVEFKQNNSEPEMIGQYISALSNSACLENKEYGYLVYGIENETHKIVGTNFNPEMAKIKKQELKNWLSTQLTPKIDFKTFSFEIKGKLITIFQIDASINTPIMFKNQAVKHIIMNV